MREPEGKSNPGVVPPHCRASDASTPSSPPRALQEDSIQIFVSIVPVCLDSYFKYWIFVGLNKQDPAAAVTLRNMDRH